MRMMEPLASRLPVAATLGNHEQDDVSFDAAGQLVIGISARYRFAGAPVPPASPDNLDYYSYNAGPMHVIGLSSFFIGGTGAASPMTAWLKADLAAIDRAATPWIILITHVRAGIRGAAAGAMGGRALGAIFGVRRTATILRPSLPPKPEQAPMYNSNTAHT